MLETGEVTAEKGGFGPVKGHHGYVASWHLNKQDEKKEKKKKKRKKNECVQGSCLMAEMLHGVVYAYVHMHDLAR